MSIWARARGWRRRTRVAKVDSYTRWLLYVLVCAYPLLNGVSALFRSESLPARVMDALCVVQVLLGVRVLQRSFDHYLWKKAAPWWPLAGQVALLLGTMGALVATVRAGGTPSPTEYGLLLMHGWLATSGPFSLLVRFRRYAAVSGGCAVLMAGATGALGATWGAMAVMAASVFALFMWVALCVRTSGWMLSVMWELEEAKKAQAQLAVAEERLRFGRDLHDVLGRNLAVIALKSELAVQLAQRGSPAALEQMTEVQRLAQDSQREVREVVRGYREADLRTELVGARGVLSAAGIDCRFDDAPGRELPPPVQSALAWVVREATTNVLRHADAGRCAVRMRIVDEVAVLVMENDGVRVEAPEAGTGSGSGLAGLRERLAALGGTITAERPGTKMFRVTAEVPLIDGEPPQDGVATGEGAPGEGTSAEGAPSEGAPGAGGPGEGAAGGGAPGVGAPEVSALGVSAPEVGASPGPAGSVPEEGGRAASGGSGGSGSRGGSGGRPAVGAGSWLGGEA
ncbi:sensor histidine kinase [Streptomyces sp. NPDC020799]|uniref:sensor histidine kinase n=1 Tax=Streptomyces sp. NPDC020799 TaxID=3365091 RepID=UPI0037BA4CA5